MSFTTPAHLTGAALFAGIAGTLLFGALGLLAANPGAREDAATHRFVATGCRARAVHSAVRSDGEHDVHHPISREF